MRELEFLHYHPGDGFWYRHDPRLKLLELALWSVLALAAQDIVLAFIAPVPLTLLMLSGIRLRRMKKPLLFWTVMALAIVGASWLSLGREGLYGGMMRSFRLLTVLLAGQLLAATTDPADLAGAVRSLTGFLPRSWSASLATGISLTISFIPRIMDEGATIRDAAMSRGLGLRRSVLRRAVTLAMPLAEATLRRADITTDALLSRSYSDDPTPPDLKVRRQDVFLFLLVILPPGLAAILVFFIR